jgi:hypothetical protein
MGAMDRIGMARGIWAGAKVAAAKNVVESGILRERRRSMTQLLGCNGTGNGRLKKRASPMPS